MTELDETLIGAQSAKNYIWKKSKKEILTWFLKITYRAPCQQFHGGTEIF